MRSKQADSGKKENRQANQVIQKAIVKEQRQEGGEGKETEARIAPSGHAPKKQRGAAP
jgi:hypothetical protein